LPWRSLYLSPEGGHTRARADEPAAHAVYGVTIPGRSGSWKKNTSVVLVPQTENASTGNAGTAGGCHMMPAALTLALPQSSCDHFCQNVRASVWASPLRSVQDRAVLCGCTAWHHVEDRHLNSAAGAQDCKLGRVVLNQNSRAYCACQQDRIQVGTAVRRRSTFISPLYTQLHVLHVRRSAPDVSSAASTPSRTERTRLLVADYPARRANPSRSVDPASTVNRSASLHRSCGCRRAPVTLHKTYRL
jgi:hypothetical protein